MRRWVAETDEQKAERTFRNIVITQHELSTKYAWTNQNGGAWGINEAEMYQKFCEDHKDFKERFMQIATPYFEKNPDMVWVPLKEYKNLLPESLSINAFQNISLTKSYEPEGSR